MYQIINKACGKACKLLDAEKTERFLKRLVYRLKYRDHLKKHKGKIRQKKIDRKTQRIAMFGKTKYYLSELFGQWILYI